MVAEVKRILGFDLTPLFIVAGTIWTHIVQSAQLLSTKMH
jgi:hypothetical protein